MFLSLRHYSVAVQTDAGLMVPIVRGADSLGLKGISVGAGGVQVDCVCVVYRCV